MAASPYSAFIGIDISKATIDLCLLTDDFSEHTKIENSVAALTALFKEQEPFCRVKFKQTLLCFENIGHYQNHLVNYLQKKKALFSIQSALHIKRSLGLVRGKSDKIDAERIALFTWKNCTLLNLWEPPREIIMILKELLTVRKRLLSIKNMLKVPAKEHTTFTTADYQKLVTANFQSTLNAVTEDLKKLEDDILQRVLNDERLARLYTIITSIPYVGFVIATNLIVVTNEFKRFDKASRFASYIGIAPFSYSSGTSLSTRPKVSKMANRELKALLHLACLSTLRRPCEMKKYYDRKKAEGKHSMLILNNMKNKLVRRIFACVREDRLFIVDRRKLLCSQGQAFSIVPKKHEPMMLS